MLKHTADRQDIDGLNTLTYKLESIKFLPLYTRVDVVINQRDVMNASPKTLPSVLQSLK